MMKQLPIRERKKSPQCKNGFLETTTVPLPRQRERIWHPGPWSLARLLYRNRRHGHVGEKQELSVISKTLLSIVRSCMIPEVWPLLSLLFTCLKQWISSKSLDANAVIWYTHHSTCYLKTVQWLFWRVENPFVTVTFFFFLREKEGRIHFAFHTFG